MYKPYGENRTSVYQFRMTAEEKERLFELAKIAGVSVTSYILGKCLGESIAVSSFNKKSKRKFSK